DVCADAGKTLYYGSVPTVSGEISEADAVFGSAEGVDFGPQSSAFRNHLVEPLRGEATELPHAGEAVAAGWSKESEQPGAGASLHSAIRARFGTLNRKSGRFEEPAARYQPRAFVRLKPEGPSPARIVWSNPSDPFVIAAWYEGAGAPPVQIPLPDPSDKGLL